ncbi:hypothetical protein HGP28_00660 [Vibrio sp. SM6]|uniref:Uncharacterized protein n=1 Tax=Vibrio agarilyticus TaxID=2726741 RepID=A0A7X8YFI1_9VIBR|nr:hypothetical protein [Vibrio agarilyticus]NLS11396.1 hypothetical protein [Vibrio agarilyticus]
MKRASNTYRLQLIKDVVTRREQDALNDPMANYIHQLLSEQPEHGSEINHRFNGCHFDEQVGGWVSDRWNMK